MSETQGKRSKTEVCSKERWAEDPFDLSDVPPAISITQRYMLRLRVPRQIRALVTKMITYALDSNCRQLCLLTNQNAQCWIHATGQTWQRIDERAARMKYMRLK